MVSVLASVILWLACSPLWYYGYCARICGVLVSVLVSSVVDRGFEPRSGKIKDFMCMLCRSLFVLLAIVLSVILRFTDSDYSFRTFKLFYKIDISCFSVKYAALRRKSKDWLFRNQDNLECSNLCVCRLLFQ